MDMPRNHFKHAIAAGQLQIGLWCSLCSSVAIEVVSHAGYDWLLLDTEHSPNDVTDILRHLQAAQSGTASCIVRPAWNDMVLIKRYLDIGAQTLLLPFVQTPEEAKRAGAELVNPYAATPANLARGKQVFDTVCFVCHGPRGEGDGVRTCLCVGGGVGILCGAAARGLAFPRKRGIPLVPALAFGSGTVGPGGGGASSRRFSPRMLRSAAPGSPVPLKR